MSAIGRRELLYNEILYPDEIIESINNVKIDDVLDVAKELFNIDNLSITFAGNLHKHSDIEDKIYKVLGEEYEN
jgi:predicted Zn-dependent peptidase